ncbi:type II toxin-antitoxin system VapC family toxin [Tsukamurella soli]|uniref:Ribonuclease VapC n=1 Tax=Tsukamurella soli TaxID=644556 RepID=A0ABP8J7U6_9ACTN
MTLVVADTSAIIAAYDSATDWHHRAYSLWNTLTMVVSPLVLDEVDHLLIARFGRDRVIANLVFDDIIEKVTDRVILIPAVDRDDLGMARDVIARYRDLRLDLTDAVSVVLAARYGIVDILTLDERHFRTAAPLTPGKTAFRLPIQDA